METLEIDLNTSSTSFLPNAKVAGRVSWRVDTPPRSAELHLMWYTEGKGTQDVGIAQSLSFDNPADFDERDFNFEFPSHPYSFSGKLISLIWAIELVLEPKSRTKRINLLMAPEQKEINLYS